MLSNRDRALSLAIAIVWALTACTPEPASDRRLGIDFGGERATVVVALCEEEELLRLTLWGNDGDRIVGEINDDPILFEQVGPPVTTDGVVDLENFPELNWRDDRFLVVETDLNPLRMFFSEIRGGPEGEARIASAGDWFERSEFEKRAGESCV